MRLLFLAAAFALLYLPSITAQEPSIENFTRFRTLTVERLARSAERLGLPGLGGSPLDANVSRVFSMPPEIRVIRAAELVFKEQRLTLTLSTNSTDVFLSDTRQGSDGASVMWVFHTDLNLILRGAAAGVDTNHLDVVPLDSNSVSAFRDRLLMWDRHLPQMLAHQPRRPE